MSHCCALHNSPDWAASLTSRWPIGFLLAAACQKSGGTRNHREIWQQLLHNRRWHRPTQSSKHRHEHLKQLHTRAHCIGIPIASRGRIGTATAAEQAQRDPQALTPYWRHTRLTGSPTICHMSFRGRTLPLSLHPTWVYPT